jgi:hypothetical protein
MVSAMSEPEVVAALGAVDVERLLPGEADAGEDVQTAEHWARIYSELMSLKESTIRQIEGRLSGMSEEARREVRSTDVIIMERELERFVERRRHWMREVERRGGPGQGG